MTRIKHHSDASAAMSKPSAGPPSANGAAIERVQAHLRRFGYQGYPDQIVVLARPTVPRSLDRETEQRSRGA